MTMLALAVLPPDAGAADTDRVVLTNGDRIAGEVKALRSGKLEFSTSTMGTVYIEWDKVAELVSPNQFEIETTSGTRFFGTIRGGAAGKLTVAMAAGAVELDIWAVVRIQPVKTGFFDRFDGLVDFGASYTKSSEIGQGWLNAELRTRRRRWEWSLTLNTTITVQPEQPESSRTVGSFRTSILLPKRWYLPAAAVVERNTELGLDLRSSVALGVGHYVIQTNRNLLGAAAGLVGNRERPTDGDSTSNAEAFLSANYSFFTYDTPKTTVTFSAALFPSLTVSKRVRSDVDVSLRREIVRDFTVGLTLYDAYDNKPPTTGAQKHDYGVTVTVGWTF